jgi:RNA polymerase sigma factor (sigma-70 family)
VIGKEFPDVLVAAQTGDPAGIEEIYRDVAPLVLGYLKSNGARDPEDTASEVFLSVVTRLDSFRGDEHQFRSWLLTITYRRLVDDLRRRGRRPEDPAPDEELGRHLGSITDGEAEAIARLRSRGVLEALEALTSDQRAALTLRVLADLPIRQISEIMGKPETAVKALVRRGFAGMGRLLARQEADERI